MGLSGTAREPNAPLSLGEDSRVAHQETVVVKVTIGTFRVPRSIQILVAVEFSHNLL
jgi:hypothetical protein